MLVLAIGILGVSASAILVKYSQAPVSYTHLDVYKRQDSHNSFTNVHFSLGILIL